MTLKVVAIKSPHPKCARCWNHREEVGKNEYFPDICYRCVQQIKDHCNVINGELVAINE